MAEAHQFTLPDVGEGLTEAEIVKWHVTVGDTVEVNDTLVEIETAKSLVDLPSLYAGVIARLHAVEGDTVAVGSVIVSFTVEAAAGDPDPALQDGDHESASVPAGEPHQAATPQPAKQPGDERQPVLVGYGPSRATVARRPRKSGYR